MTTAERAAVAAWLTTHTVTHCRVGFAASRLRWYCQCHPTRLLPLSLGRVGRW